MTMSKHNDLRQQYLHELETNTGTPYVFGGKTKGRYDCSGLLTDAARRIGLNLGDPLMTSAEGLKQRCDPIPYTDVLPGDLLLFHSTYADFGPGYATHCGASYGVGTFRMYDTHEPVGCGVTDTSAPYWQEHLLGAWRPRMFADGAPAPTPVPTKPYEQLLDEERAWGAAMQEIMGRCADVLIEAQRTKRWAAVREVADELRRNSQ